MNSKLDFKQNIQNVLNKVKKVIGLLCKLQKILPRPPFITTDKSFIIYVMEILPRLWRYYLQSSI